MIAILGTKIGMTQYVNAKGEMIPATAILAGPCVVTDVKTADKHGYRAAQIGYQPAKERLLSKALAGYFKKKNLKPMKHLREIRLSDKESLELGQEIKVDVFKAGDAVDVQGTSIGKGFAGGMKRWHWRGGPNTHGSMFHRRIGSVGASSFPSRTWPGHKMPGHLGNVTKSVQNLEVLRVDAERNLMLVKGSVPGSDHGILFIRKALKLPEGIKVRVEPKQKEKKDPLKASKQAAAGKGKK